MNEHELARRMLRRAQGLPPEEVAALCEQYGITLHPGYVSVPDDVPNKIWQRVSQAVGWRKVYIGWSPDEWDNQ